MQKNFYVQYSELIVDVQKFLEEEYSKKKDLYTQPSFIQNILHSRTTSFNTLPVQLQAKKVPTVELEQEIPLPSIDDFQGLISPSSPIEGNQKKEVIKSSAQETPKNAIQLKSKNISDESKEKVKPSIPFEKSQKKNKTLDSGSSNNNFINLEFPETSLPIDFMPFKIALKEHFPQIKILEEIPDDNIAKVLGQKWKQKINFSPIIIFNLNETSSASAFLNNIAKALNVVFGKGQEQVATVISPLEIQELVGWDAFFKYPHQLIISKDIDVIVSKLPELKNFYKESQKSGKFYLGTIPLILLSDFSFYLKDCTLKRNLWNSICTYLRSKNLS